MTGDERGGEPGDADIRVAPPLLFAGALALGLVAGRLPRSETYGTLVRRIVGALSVLVGAAVGANALAEIVKAGSSPSPFTRPTALATGGAFRFSRNPAYFGATSLYVGVALLARSIPAFVLLPVALALLDKTVVDKEERALEATFGADYRTYRDRVPRWF